MNKGHVSPDSRESGKNYITTGTLARLAGISRETLTFYIRSGLVKPKYVAENKYKYFLPEQIQTIHFIRYYRKMGFSLDTIREKLAIYHDGNSNPDLKSLLDEQKSRLESRIQSLQAAIRFVEWEERLYNYLHSREPDRPFFDTLPEQEFLLTPVPFKESLNDPDNAQKLARFFTDSTGEFQVPQYPLCCRIMDVKFLPAIIKKKPDSPFCPEQDPSPHSEKPTCRQRAGRYGCMIHSGDATHLPHAIDHLISWLTGQNIPLTGTGYVVNSCDFINITENQKTLFLILVELYDE